MIRKEEKKEGSVSLKPIKEWSLAAVFNLWDRMFKQGGRKGEIQTVEIKDR